jgi:superfamily I DNA and RNA helicase
MYKKLGYQNEDIVLLSFSNDTESAAARSDLGVQVHPFWSNAGSGIRYATVNAFKGLEAKKVILTDVTMDGSYFRRNQLYTGITRSTESAIILCHDSAKKTILQYLKQSDLDNNE